MQNKNLHIALLGLMLATSMQNAQAMKRICARWATLTLSKHLKADLENISSKAPKEGLILAEATKADYLEEVERARAKFWKKEDKGTKWMHITMATLLTSQLAHQPSLLALTVPLISAGIAGNHFIDTAYYSIVDDELKSNIKQLDLIIKAFEKQIEQKNSNIAQ